MYTENSKKIGLINKMNRIVEYINTQRFLIYALDGRFQDTAPWNLSII